MEGNLGKEILRKKKDKNEKFYFGKVEALASIVPNLFAFCMLFMNFCFKN